MCVSGDHICAVTEGDCECHLQSKTEKHLGAEFHLQRRPAILPAKGYSLDSQLAKMFSRSIKLV